MMNLIAVNNGPTGWAICDLMTAKTICGGLTEEQSKLFAAAPEMHQALECQGVMDKVQAGRMELQCALRNFEILGLPRGIAHDAWVVALREIALDKAGRES